MIQSTEIKSIRKSKEGGYIIKTSGLQVMCSLTNIKDVRKVFSKSIAHKYILERANRTKAVDNKRLPSTDTTDFLTYGFYHSIRLAITSLALNVVDLDTAIALGNLIANFEITSRLALPVWVAEDRIAKEQIFDALDYMRQLVSRKSS